VHCCCGDVGVGVVEKELVWWWKRAFAAALSVYEGRYLCRPFMASLCDVLASWSHRMVSR